ncbi:MAG: hypothetical protein J6N54_07715 [Bacteroidales bacterium]|nr:hypothetical protein [Bacteroidales bacterium]
MRLKYLLTILSLPALLFSCVRRVETSYPSIDLVNTLVSDSLPALRKMAEGAGKASGTIVLVGDPMRCLSLSEKMIGCDEFDNVDAREVSDGLPDFAGETIVSIFDFIVPSYDSLSVEGVDSTLFRERAVKNALAALDSSVACKVLVLCSPQLGVKGGDDVVDLFGKIGCDVPVIFSSDTAFSFTKACYRVMRERNIFTHDIAYPSARLFMLLGPEDEPFSPASIFDDNLAPAQFADTIGVFAPDTYYSHVQNKHNTGRNR